ncbi:hypothetical protein NEUTE2DRAFT_44112, partial [Neurospora tetrasperma FGSC 2509]
MCRLSPAVRLRTHPIHPPDYVLELGSRVRCVAHEHEKGPVRGHAGAYSGSVGYCCGADVLGLCEPNRSCKPKGWKKTNKAKKAKKI